MKFSPPLSEETVSLSRPALSIMMIWVSPPALPMADPLAVEFVMLTVRKSVSGRMPPLAVQHGASTMTSADESAAPARRSALKHAQNDRAAQPSSRPLPAAIPSQSCASAVESGLMVSMALHPHRRAGGPDADLRPRFAGPASPVRTATVMIAAARRALSAHGPGLVVGLALGLLALGPGLRRGFLLSYDMVFVPREPFTSAMFGLAGGAPRAVPSDFAVAVASRLLPADIVQKLVLLLIFVLACSGAVALLDREPVLARLAYQAGRRSSCSATRRIHEDSGRSRAPAARRSAGC